MAPPPSEPRQVDTVAALRATVAEWRRSGLSVALVPTMGALHRAHIALVEAAQARCDRTVVSIFVNPRQFGPAEDFSRYPRRTEDDLSMLRSAGVDLVFAPGGEEMYRTDAATTVSVGGSLTAGLCAAVRPGHFEGVATVCTKLFLQCLPDIATFGEKDYQQLLIVRRMVRDLDIPVEIVAVPTVRDADGLALSSRNVYLGEADLARAVAVNRVLATVAGAVAAGGDIETETRRGLEALRAAGISEIDYLEVRDAETLAPVTDPSRPARVFAAVRIAGTRLIDNRPIPLPRRP